MIAYLLVLIAIVSHVAPHPWISFTAIGGSLLYFGARRSLAQAAVPVALLAFSDYYLTVHFYNYPFHASFYLLTWAWYAGAIVLGRVLLRERTTVGRTASAVLLSSTSFFLLSNFAAWVPPGLYPHTFSGLMTCYAAGLPFYRNDLLSTALVAGLVFGLPLAFKKADESAEATGVRPA